MKEKLGGDKLYALVNNAGTGGAHGVTAQTVIQTNLIGTKRMSDAFLPLLDTQIGRVVNVSSDMGPSYVQNLP